MEKARWVVRARRLAVTVAAIAAAASATAWAGVYAAASTGAIDACANDTNGLLRLVAGASDCRAHERYVSWAAAGPAGPRGAAVVQRIRGGGAVAVPADSAAHAYPLTGASWTQGANEVDWLVGGYLTLTMPMGSGCSYYVGATVKDASDNLLSIGALLIVPADGASHRVRLADATEFEPGAPSARELHARVTLYPPPSQVAAACAAGGAATVTDLSADVVALD